MGNNIYIYIYIHRRHPNLSTDIVQTKSSKTDQGNQIVHRSRSGEFVKGLHRWVWVTLTTMILSSFSVDEHILLSMFGIIGVVFLVGLAHHHC